MRTAHIADASVPPDVVPHVCWKGTDHDVLTDWLGIELEQTVRRSPDSDVARTHREHQLRSPRRVIPPRSTLSVTTFTGSANELSPLQN